MIFWGKRLRLVYMHDCCLPWWIEPFKSAAVQSDQSQEFQICAFSRRYKLFLNLKTEGNIDSVFLLPIKPCKRWLCLSEGKKRSRRSHIDILFCCFVWLTKKKDKYVYDQSSDFHLTFNFQQLFPYMSHPSFVCSYLPESNCKLSKARQAISDAAECTACIPCSAVMSSIRKVGIGSFKDSKTKLPTGRVNILQHTLVPQSSTGNVESLNLDQAQMGTTAHTALWNGEKDGQLHRGSPDGTSQTSAACCMTRVGTEWELVHCPLPGCVCVCLRLWLNFSGQDILGKNIYEENHFSSQLTALPCQCSLPPDGAAAGIGHAFIYLF